MIDTIKFTVFEENILEKMNSREFLFLNRNLKNDRISLFGWDKNFKITVYDHKITFEGSIPKYLFGNNIQEINFVDLIKFIQTIENAYDISLSNAKITRIDLCTNIETAYPVKYYLDSLISKDRCNTASFKSTKIFGNTLKSIKLYDKVAEVKAKNRENFQKIKGKKILRIETVLNSKMIKLLLCRSLFLHDLLSKNTFDILMQFFTNEVLSVRTNAVYKIEISKFSVKRLSSNLACIGMDFIGGQSAVHGMIDNAYNDKSINSSQKLRAKKKADSIIDESDFLQNYSYANELQEKFIQKISNFKVEE